MNPVVNGIQSLLHPTALTSAVIAFSLLALLLSLGRGLEPALNLERLGIPAALLAGLAGLLLGPYGPIPLLPQSVTDIWTQLPTPLLTLVFATLMLGRPLPRAAGLVEPVASQALLGLLLGFGQYLVGGLVVLLVLIPMLGVDPLMGCLIEVGFEGGHGAAAAMGESFRELGFPGGQDLGLAMATVGLLSSTVLGSALVVLGRWRGWLAPENPQAIGITGADEEPKGFGQQLRALAINLALAGGAVGIGVLLLSGLRLLSPWLGEFYSQVIHVFPVFPLALGGSLLIRFVLEKSGKTQWASQILQREIGTLATDLLITAATASLNLPLLLHDWLPLTILSVTGLAWNLFGMLVLAPLSLKEEWFERSITEFGQATGVAASGLLLLRLADPRNLTNALQVFSIKQLLLQPVLSGGIITVVAPLAVNRLGLIGWTELCGILTGLSITLALALRNWPNKTVASTILPQKADG